MKLERFATYRPDTWKAVTTRLDGLSDQELLALSQRASIDVGSKERDDLLEALLERGGFLLVELGLTTDMPLMNRTVFSCGGLEYVINAEATELLASKDGSARLDIIGGGKSRNFTYSELMHALVESPDFDQLEDKENRTLEK